jgi:GTP-binding protein
MKQKELLQEITDSYIVNRKNLKKVIILLDSRRGILEDDLTLIRYLDSLEIPFITIGTKLDKLTQSQKYKFEKQVSEKLGVTPTMYSATSKKNLDIVELQIENLL